MEDLSVIRARAGWQPRCRGNAENHAPEQEEAHRRPPEGGAGAGHSEGAGEDRAAQEGHRCAESPSKHILGISPGINV